MRPYVIYCASHGRTRWYGEILRYAESELRHVGSHIGHGVYRRRVRIKKENKKSNPPRTQVPTCTYNALGGAHFYSSISVLWRKYRVTRRCMYTFLWSGNPSMETFFAKIVIIHTDMSIHFIISYTAKRNFWVERTSSPSSSVITITPTSSPYSRNRLEKKSCVQSKTI